MARGRVQRAWLLLGVLLTQAAWAQVGLGAGLVSIDSASMRVKSAMAVWNPDSEFLTITFFPFVLSPAQLQALERYPADYVVADSPKPKPFFRLNLQFKQDSRGQYRAEDVRSSTLSAWRIGPRTESLTLQGAPKDLSLEGDFRNQGNLIVTLKGEHRSPFEGRRVFGWNVSAHCRVYRHQAAPSKH